MDALKEMLKITAAYCETQGIPNPTGKDFSAEELRDAHEQLEEAERDLYGDAAREQASEDRHNDQHRGAVPKTWSR